MTKVITFFDICSSSKITEDLSLSNNLHLWQETPRKIEGWLEKKCDNIGFSIYKFLGDGWILIIDNDTDKKALLQFFAELCSKYSDNFYTVIEKKLSTEIKPVGLTFGLDIGEIYDVKIGGITEYMGPTLNIAARLQSCVQRPDCLSDDPSNKLFMIRNNYFNYFKDYVGGDYKVEEKTRRTLRNIRNDGTFICSRIWLTKDLTDAKHRAAD